MNFSLLTILTHNTILSGTILFVLGAWFYFGRDTDRNRTALSALLFYGSLWLMSYSLQLHSENPVHRLHWIRSLYVIASFLPFFFYVLVDTLAKGRPTPQRFQIIAAAPSLVLVAVIYSSSLIVSRLGWGLSVGPAMVVFQVYYVVMTAAAVATLITSHKVIRQKLGRSFYYLTVGVLATLGSLFAILQMVNMSATQQQDWYGGLAAVTMLSGLLIAVYAVDYQDFMVRMRPVGMELFLLVVMLTLVINVVISPEIVAFSIRLAVLLVLVLYGAMAVRSFSREVVALRDRERLHRDLEITNKQLILSDRTKTRLLSFASHQLRAVVSGIKGYLDMLNDGDFGELNERQKNVTGVTLVAADRLGDTVETFLDVALVERGELRLRMESVDALQFVRRAVQEFAPMAAKKNISLAFDAPSEMDPVFCDPRRLYHAVANLIHNAINYTDKGGIMVTAEMKDGRFFVEVNDTGTGIDDISRQHVEDLFDRGLEAVRFESSGGSGLGLHVAKVIVDAHKGKLFFSSGGPGKGSSFGFWIPVK